MDVFFFLNVYFNANMPLVLLVMLWKASLFSNVAYSDQSLNPGQWWDDAWPSNLTHLPYPFTFCMLMLMTNVSWTNKTLNTRGKDHQRKPVL